LRPPLPRRGAGIVQGHPGPAEPHPRYHRPPYGGAGRGLRRIRGGVCIRNRAARAPAALAETSAEAGAAHRPGVELVNIFSGEHIITGIFPLETSPIGVSRGRYEGRGVRHARFKPSGPCQSDRTKLGRLQRKHGRSVHRAEPARCRLPGAGSRRAADSCPLGSRGVIRRQHTPAQVNRGVACRSIAVNLTSALF